MRKLILSFIAIAFLYMIVPAELKANEEISNAKETETLDEVKTELNRMVDRVVEINEMDLKELLKDERKEIKKDFKTYSKAKIRLLPKQQERQ